MKISLDVDGVLCELRRPDQTYAEVQPLPGAVEKMKALKAAGHYLILSTARHMATCNSNTGLVIARQGKTLLDWLAQHEIPYDELWFGKPHADVYIDDNGYRFTGWKEIAGDGGNLPLSKEKALARDAAASQSPAKNPEPQIMTTPAAPKLNIVMPMAGLGSRFRDAGYQTPKPLIEVRGRPMYAWATDSLPLDHCGRLIFILLGSQPECPALTADIQRRYAKLKPEVLTVPELTAGQAITVLRAKELIDTDEPLLIHNADTGFDVDHGWVEQALAQQLDGALLVFRSSDKRWSFSREGDNGFVAEVREKEVISPWATTGAYWFRRGSDFVRTAEARYQSGRREASEFYVGPLYNDLIAKGAKVKNFPIRRLYCFGTPEDLAETVLKFGM